MGDKFRTHVNISDNVFPLKVGSSGLEESVRINHHQCQTDDVRSKLRYFLTFLHYCQAFLNLAGRR